MADFFAMHGYAAYIWPAYAIFFVVLIADALTPLLQRRRALRDVRSRLTRQAPRSAPAENNMP